MQLCILRRLKLVRNITNLTEFCFKMPPRKLKTQSKETGNDKPIPEITVPDIEDSYHAIKPWEPKNWKTTLENIKKMRTLSVAPVDTMGCHKFIDNKVDEKTQRFHVLVSLMLSSQTKDEVTFEAMKRLTSSGLTPSSIVEMEANALQELLKPVSFYKNKAKHLQLTARILIDKYDSDIPKTIKELVALPGVGPKMAHLAMAAAWNEVTGIGVDVHVHRIVNRLRWVPKETKDPEKTRVALEEWLPRILWSEVNHLLVGFGQTICTPLRPHCNECLNRDICPSAETGAGQTKPKGRKKAAAKIESTEDIEESGIAIIKKSKFQKKKMQI